MPHHNIINTITHPILSVIMPVYNREWCLSKAIETILGQTFTDFEIIIADDNSTDSTPEIIKKYSAADSRIKPLFLEKRGHLHAINRAVEIANGNIAARVDSDDISMPRDLKNRLNI
ncbi:MAG: glycosyltransferase family 2 protein [Candidatus Riflebacteria bacterium]|nr:glycosyltransferase family 2 protein [Candidatus Riflebacteria bacterium]